MRLIYSGPKPERTVQFPIPVLQKSEIVGEVKFVRGVETEIKDEWGQKLIEMAPEYYKLVPKSTLPNAQPKG